MMEWSKYLQLETAASRARELRNALRDDRLADALSMSIEALERDPSCVPALLAVSLVAQLSDDETPGVSLDDARRALECASEIEALCGEADHEYGRFLFAVNDDSEAAIRVYQQGIARREAELCDLEVALVEGLVDVGKTAEARSRLLLGMRRFPDSRKLRDLQAELR